MPLTPSRALAAKPAAAAPSFAIPKPIALAPGASPLCPSAQVAACADGLSCVLEGRNHKQVASLKTRAIAAQCHTVIARALESYSHDAAFQRRGLRALLTMASGGAEAGGARVERLCEVGAMGIALRAMHAHLSDPSVQLTCLELLDALVALPQMKQRAFQAGIFIATCAAVFSHVDQLADVALYGCRILNQLVVPSQRDEDAAFLRGQRAVHDGAIPAIVRALRAHGSRHDVFAAGSGALSAIVRDDRDLQVAAMKAGALLEWLAG